MITAYAWPARHLIAQLVHGFQCVGDYPDSGIFRAEERPATRNINELHHPPHNERLMAEAAAEGAAAVAAGGEKLFILQRLAKKKDDEIGIGSAVRHDSFESVDALYGAGRWRAHKCFGVVQGTEKDGSPKVRPCDNCKSSLTNECLAAHETISSENCMFPSLVAALFDELGVTSLQIGTDDVRLAYRMMGCATPQFTVVVLYHPELGRPVLYTMRGHNCRPAPASNRDGSAPAAPLTPRSSPLQLAWLRRSTHSTSSARPQSTLLAATLAGAAAATSTISRPSSRRTPATQASWRSAARWSSLGSSSTAVTRTWRWRRPTASLA